MGPEYWKPGSPTALKKCSERVSNSCTDETDGCCAVIPCAYCIEWNPETGATVYATADFATNSWSATIAGAAWLGFWERNAESGECEFVVTLDAAEIYRKSCYEGQSCRDSSDSASTTIDYVDGVITWTKFLSRPLQYVQDQDTNCTVHFCDQCECSAECLCVEISESGSIVAQGEICDTAYDCEPPLWQGTVGYYELSVALGRDEYGRCIVTLTVDSEEQEPVLFPGCGDAEATVTLYDGTTISLRAKKCSCDECPDEPCDCEFSTDFTCLEGTLVSTTIPGDTCAGATVAGGNHTIADAYKKWVIGEDTDAVVLWDGFNITIPCGLDPLALVGALVRRSPTPSGPSPYVDNDIVQPCEYYFVMYSEDLSSHVIYYEYEYCCGQAEAAPRCSTRLSWIKFTNVSAGRGVYDFLFWIPSGSVVSGGNGVLTGQCPLSDGPNPCLS